MPSTDTEDTTGDVISDHELDQLFDDDQRCELDIAAEIVDRALEITPATTHHTAAARHIAVVIQHDDLTVSDEVWELAVNSPERPSRDYPLRSSFLCFQ